MSNFFSKLDKIYNWWNDEGYKYLLFLYYLNSFTKSLYAFLLGVLAGLSLPPVNFFIVLPFVFASVIRLTDFCENKIKAFFVGFWFCFGFFLTGFYWISFAILTEGTMKWLFPFAFFGIPFALSVYTAILFPIYLHIVQYSSAIKKIFIFAALWVLFEAGRLYIFQFPWNFLGYSMTLSINMLQITSIIGILGLSFVIVLWACSFHILLLTGDKTDFIKYFKFLLFNNILLVLIFAFGILHLASFKEKFTDTTIRIVQGNTPISANFKDGYDVALENYVQLTTSRSLQAVDYIIWPEGGVHSVLFEEKNKTRLSKLLKLDQILIAGSVRYEKNISGFEIFNSMIFVNSLGGAEFYDKNHLVPFGEFVPFKGLIPMPAVASQLQDFSRGGGLKSLKLSAKVPAFSPLICYEIAFTGNAVKRNNIKPEWILNITNDAWYGISSGPFQHLEIARVRGIEEGMPVVRAANSGISAVFDETGKMLAKTRFFAEEVIDFKLPLAQTKYTIFSLVGNIPLIFGLILFILYAICDFLYIKHDKKINEMGYKIKTKKTL